MKLGFVAVLAYAFGMIIVATIWLSPDARSYPQLFCGPGATKEITPWAGYCDAPQEGQGQHWHCEWIGGWGGCDWRWGDNQPAPPPCALGSSLTCGLPVQE